MTKNFRTLLLLGFTGLALTLSGCFVETTSNNGGGAACGTNQYFQVYWSADNGPGTNPLYCDQVPASHVELLTNTGTYRVGIECRATNYMNFTFDFVGSTNNVPVGTYVITANLVDNVTSQVISSSNADPQYYATYSIQACRRLELGYLFSLN